MAKKGYFNEVTMNTIGRLVGTADGKAIVDYGKGNFLLGATSAALFAVTGWAVYEIGKYAVSVVKYFKA